MRKVNALVLRLAVLLAVVGCASGNESETSAAAFQNANLVLTKVQTNNGYSFHEKNYVYDSTGQLTEIRLAVYEIVHTSTGTDTTLFGAETEKLVYNTAGQLISRIRTVAGTNPDSVGSRQDFEYNAANQISKLIRTTKINGVDESTTELLAYNAEKQLSKTSVLDRSGKEIAYALYTYPTFNTVKVESYSALQGPPVLVETQVATLDSHKCPNPLDRHTQAFVLNLSGQPFSAFNVESVTIQPLPGNQREISYSYVYNEAGYPIKCTQNQDQTEVTFFYK